MINNYVVFDLEMTGLQAKRDQIIEIGAVKVENGRVVDSFELLVNPQCKLPEKIVALTGITDDMLKDAQHRDVAVEQFISFVGNHTLVGHNINFDYSFIKQWAINHGFKLEWKGIDSLKLARKLLPKEQGKTLEALCAYFQIERSRAHRALDDAKETQLVFEQLQELYESRMLEEVKEIELVYHGKKQTPATKHQLQRLQEYREKHKIDDEIPWNNLSRSEASRIMDRYILHYGR